MDMGSPVPHSALTYSRGVQGIVHTCRLQLSINLKVFAPRFCKCSPMTQMLCRDQATPFEDPQTPESLCLGPQGV